MSEGRTTVHILKVLVIGPPGSGKTCVRHLLLDLPPPAKRSSTPIATRVARAICMSRIRADDSGFTTWKEMDNETYLDFIAHEVRLLDPQQYAVSSPSLPTINPVTDGSVPEETSVNPASEGRTPQQKSVKELSKEEEQFSLSTQATDKVQFTTPQGTRASDEDVYSSIPSPSETEGTENMDRIVRKMVLNPKSSKEPERKRFVHLIDSGGQPSFISLVPAFIRGSTVNVVATKLDQRLSEKLPYEYVKANKHLRQPTQLAQTQLELTEELIRSLSSVQHSKISGAKYRSASKFLVVGTHADKYHPTFTETLDGKNRQLGQKLGKLRSMCIACGPKGGFIFPVNTLTKKDRSKVAGVLRQKIMEAQSSGAEVEIPTRWYIFELELGSKAKKEGRSVLGLVECQEIGKKLKMGEEDVIAALVFLDEVTLCLFFRGTVPHLVFTDPQAILSELTELMNIGIVDLQYIPSHYPMEAVLRLREEGLFDKKLVAIVCHSYRVHVEGKCSYTVEDFLSILKCLLIVAQVTIDGEKLYFLPSILPTIKKVRPPSGELAPLLLTCHIRVIPLGMFSAIVVALLDRSMSPVFTLHKIQYCNAVQLHCLQLGGVVSVVESTAWLEIHYNGSPTVASCIRVALYEAIATVCHQRQYDTEQVKFEDGFWCPFSPKCDNVPHPCGVAHSTKWLTCSISPSEHAGMCCDQTKLAWLSTGKL